MSPQVTHSGRPGYENPQFPPLKQHIAKAELQQGGATWPEIGANPSRGCFVSAKPPTSGCALSRACSINFNTFRARWQARDYYYSQVAERAQLIARYNVLVHHLGHRLCVRVLQPCLHRILALFTQVRLEGLQSSERSKNIITRAQGDLLYVSAVRCASSKLPRIQAARGYKQRVIVATRATVYCLVSK
jgi:hypothetical protein